MLATIIAIVLLFIWVPCTVMCILIYHFGTFFEGCEDSLRLAVAYYLFAILCGPMFAGAILVPCISEWLANKEQTFWKRGK